MSAENNPDFNQGYLEALRFTGSRDMMKARYAILKNAVFRIPSEDEIQEWNNALGRVRDSLDDYIMNFEVFSELFPRYAKESGLTADYHEREYNKPLRKLNVLFGDRPGLTTERQRKFFRDYFSLNAEHKEFLVRRNVISPKA